MLAISLNWNGQALHRTSIEANKGDEISLAHFFCNLKEVPLLDPFSDLPLSIKVIIYVISCAFNLRIIDNVRILSTKSDDVHRLSGTKGRRRRVRLARLAATRLSGQNDNYKGQSRSEMLSGPEHL